MHKRRFFWFWWVICWVVLPSLPSISAAAIAERDVDNQELEALLDSGVKLIDVRRPEEWRQTGVVEGSHLITAFDARGRLLPRFVAEVEALIEAGEPFALICRVGNRTANLTRVIVEQVGYEAVYNVEAGILGWIREGRPVRRDCSPLEQAAQC